VLQSNIIFCDICRFNSSDVVLRRRRELPSFFYINQKIMYLNLTHFCAHHILDPFVIILNIKALCLSICTQWKFRHASDA